MPFQRYLEAIDYLQRRLWHELPIVPVERALQGRIRTLLGHLGDPHTAFPVLHITGSAGKGSTATMAASILRAAGLRTGLYTSPHLQTFIERIDVDGRLIAPDEFARTVLALDPLVRQMHIDVLDGIGYGRPSLVEVAFAAGMQHFDRERCAAAVIEAGLGGRTDYSNVFDAKPVSVITNVDYEHRERLGWSLRSVASEKSAIIRGTETVVTAATRKEALAVIAARCAETGAPLWRLGHEVRARVTASGAAGAEFSLAVPDLRAARLRVPLAGAHQVANAAVAAAAAVAFARARGTALDAHHLREGLAAVRISGRLEEVSAQPRVLLDSAHNPVEARCLADALRRHWLAGGARLHLVVGILADKDQAPMVRSFASVAHRVVVTQPPLGERIGDPERMLALFRRALGPARVAFEPSHVRALDLALGDAAPDDVVCVTGSMFLVGAARERWVPEARILERRSAVAADQP
ncbi:MAG TPA: Mur ligase family protein [Dehalococcoidia bacterium]|nr:Mur ligase family protein [Dehalococcoidia bacterium]